MYWFINFCDYYLYIVRMSILSFFEYTFVMYKNAKYRQDNGGFKTIFLNKQNKTKCKILFLFLWLTYLYIRYIFIWIYNIPKYIRCFILFLFLAECVVEWWFNLQFFFLCFISYDRWVCKI